MLASASASNRPQNYLSTFKAPPKEWVAHRLADLKGVLEQETEDSALVLRRLPGSITLHPTRPDIGRP